MLRLLDRLEEILIASLIAAATVIIFASVTHRYALSGLASLITYARVHDYTLLFGIAKSSYFGLKAVNLIWAQELCIIMFVWMAKFGAAYGVRTGIHVGIDVVINRLSPERRFAFILFGLCAGAFFTGTIAALGANFVWHMYSVSSISPDLELPMWIVYLAIPLGSSLMCFRFLQVAYGYLRTGELPHHDHGHVDGMDEIEDAIAHSPLTPKDR
ncbi:TRAP transporter small permease [Rhizobium sp. C4]|uniref:TRAP transporter small permease n=1 Tax=Rhizobium sp. C4 TaxID=1349800 RepID=UPI001E2ABF7D|nr:TRAP transporter small permease [Rhizobium sp. C4]MCD2172339.1 TRAP transporter small permease [Rhizobium sp. C4]